MNVRDDMRDADSTAARQARAGAESVFDVVVEAFERDWRAGDEPSIRAALRAFDDVADAAERAQLLEHLVGVDLEFRWKRRGFQGEPGPKLEHYLADLPEIDSTPWMRAALAAEEYRVRRRWGDSPGRDEYHVRFPAAAGELEARLQRVEDELAQDEEYLNAGKTLGSGEIPSTFGGEAVAAGAAMPVIDGFELIERIGRGGMGGVFKARQRRLNRFVAIKTLRPGLADDPEARRRFQIEAESAARLRHPNIVQVYDVGESGGQAYVVMELVTGLTLTAALGGSTFTSHSAARLAEVLARAIQAAHAEGIVHRDLKPSNVLIPRPDVDGGPIRWETLKISDFGLAKRLEEADAAAQTWTGAILGTPEYMAPEQTGGSGIRIGPAADIYAIGAVLYESLVGRPPFRGSSALETIELVRAHDLVSPSRLRANLPRDLVTICLQCLRLEPSRRYASALELAEDLRRFQAGEPITARPVATLERAWLTAKRHPLPAALAAAFVLACATLIVGGLAYNVRLRRAHTLAEARRTEAEANFRDAFESIRTMLRRVADEQLSNVPEMEEVRRKLLHDAKDLLAQLLKRRGERDPEVLREVALTDVALGKLYSALGDRTQAKEHYKSALAIQNSLRADATPDNPVHVDRVATLGLLADARGTTETIALLEECLAFWETRDHNDPEVVAQLAGTALELAQSLDEIGRRREGDAMFAKSLDLYEENAKREPERFNYPLGIALYDRGLVLMRYDENREADTLLRRALGILEAGSLKKGDDAALFRLSECLTTLATVNSGFAAFAADPKEARRLREQAIDFSRRSVAIREELAKRHPRLPAERRGLAGAFNQYATHLADIGRFDAAADAYRRAVEIREALAGDPLGDADDPIPLAECLQNFALNETRLGRMREARAALERALALIKLPKEPAPRVRALNALASICVNLSNTVRALDGPAAALPYNDRAVEAIETALTIRPEDANLAFNRYNAHGARAQTLESLRRPADARRDIEVVAAYGKDRQHTLNQLWLALNSLQLKRYDDAENEYDALRITQATDVNLIYNASCLQARFVKVLRADDRIAPDQRLRLIAEHAATALECLSRVARAGMFDKENDARLLVNDEDLDPIRDEPELQELVRRYAKKLKK